MCTDFWWGKLKKKTLRKPGRRWKKNNKVGLKRYRPKGFRLDSSGSRQVQVAGSCE